MNSSSQAIEDAHAVAVLTEWDEFISIHWEEQYAKMKKPAFVFDGRNILERERLTQYRFYQLFQLGK